MMKLGMFLEGTGHHTASWRDPEVDPHGRQSLSHYLDIARLADIIRTRVLKVGNPP